MVDYNLEKLVRGEFKLEEGIQRKKELMITEDNICKSTLDIWCRKEEFHPELFQYEVYKCFILRFDLSYSCFFNPEVDMYHYTLKDIAYTDKIDEFRSGNAKEFFDNCMIIDKKTSSEFVNHVYFENGEWYFGY